jgi:hypothetical protein
MYPIAQMYRSPRLRLDQIPDQESTEIVYIWQPAHLKKARQCILRVLASIASRRVALSNSPRMVYRRRILVEPTVGAQMFFGGPPNYACTRHATVSRHIE